jgi:transcriptional regulator with XRE-family HTH domain
MAVPLTLSQALAQWIRELLVREHWSQRDLAKRLDVSQASVNKLLTGERREGELEFYDTLARVFGLSLSELIADLEARVAASGGRPVPGLPPALERRLFRLVHEYAHALQREAAPQVTIPEEPPPPTVRLPPAPRLRPRRPTRKGR